jgi:hypothetical protein
VNDALYERNRARSFRFSTIVSPLITCPDD